MLLLKRTFAIAGGLHKGPSPSLFNVNVEIAISIETRLAPQHCAIPLDIASRTAPLPLDIVNDLIFAVCDAHRLMLAVFVLDYGILKLTRNWKAKEIFWAT